MIQIDPQKRGTRSILRTRRRHLRMRSGGLQRKKLTSRRPSLLLQSSNSTEINLSIGSLTKLRLAWRERRKALKGNAPTIMESKEETWTRSNPTTYLATLSIKESTLSSQNSMLWEWDKSSLRPEKFSSRLLAVKWIASSRCCDPWEVVMTLFRQRSCQ